MEDLRCYVYCILYEPKKGNKAIHAPLHHDTILLVNGHQFSMSYFYLMEIGQICCTFFQGDTVLRIYVASSLLIQFLNCLNI